MSPDCLKDCPCKGVTIGVESVGKWFSCLHTKEFGVHNYETVHSNIVNTEASLLVRQNITSRSKTGHWWIPQKNSHLNQALWKANLKILPTTAEEVLWSFGNTSQVV